MEYSTQTVVIHREQSFKFLDDISSRAVALFTNPCFVKNIGARMCARIFGEQQAINKDIEDFASFAMMNLRTKLMVNGLVSFDSCMESNVKLDPREIHINGEWYYHATKASLNDPTEYRLHVLLGTIKLLHELFHCLTPSFINYRNQCEPDLKPLTETPPDMGKKAVTKVRQKRGEKGIRLIGDMGFAMEEVLFGGQRLFHYSRPDDYHYSIEKLYLQEYDMKTFEPINYDINVDFLWAIFDVPEKLFVLRDFDQLRLLKIELPPSPQESSTSSSSCKRFSTPINTASSTKISRQILESPSTGGLFNSDLDEDSEDEIEDQLLNPWLPPGRKA
ncbi:unnamed protein product [Rotaria sp. Silwood1]|nr:unnamed protein product [Rotaria sp. Silwood1]